MKWHVFASIAALFTSVTNGVDARSDTDRAGRFHVGQIAYFANIQEPKLNLSLPWASPDQDFLATVVRINASEVTHSAIQAALQRYTDPDDVYSAAFNEVIILQLTGCATLHGSPLSYLRNSGTTHVLVQQSDLSTSHDGLQFMHCPDVAELAPGPYHLRIVDGRAEISEVYRLYEDTYRDFLYGTYPVCDATARFVPFDTALPSFRYPAIPVPSRLYSIDDPRPFAGYRIAVKDLFDINGLLTTGGSQAWGLINLPANKTAPAIQRILDLGGTIVGKFKLAQFASGADPWFWQDEHYPFNPRGDGWLSCSASSSGGGCSIAAYDWLDFAIGSDTGESMRLPAAVSGTYGQRPSQGMINLEDVLPVSGACDTAGVFARDPRMWVHFSKHWYAADMHQNSSITGLSPLVVPDTKAYPKTILYPIDYLPLNNSLAQPILDAFVANLTSVFGMQVKKFNLTATLSNASAPEVANFLPLTTGPFDVLNTYTQYETIGKPLIDKWAEMFDGRFPPIDPARRQEWHEYNETTYTQEAYNDALRQKRAAVEWYESQVQFSTPESCSESVLIYDIGPGGLPSYREEGLNNNANSTFLGLTPKGTLIPGAIICPIFGCADFTIPIGQVAYWSEVSFHQEKVPVTINMVVKRGCDFVLYNIIDELAQRGVLTAVKTGREAF